ncbi:small EDRK-rich factor 2 isoform X1 [Myotis daubentonii]|uniref:small EDRK-rich factor 2 isoform X1 n=1 Tax=Myotis daubentonii TaxID=98922 RepID=UPI002872B4CF|nr:small EDRK-rich factor 2 isoform X1 [Myotis daubentonii]
MGAGAGRGEAGRRERLRYAARKGRGRQRRSERRDATEAGGNQRELARQKNMKKQSDSVKGKRRDDGLSAAARKQRDSEIMQQKQKKANEKKEEPK